MTTTTVNTQDTSSQNDAGKPSIIIALITLYYRITTMLAPLALLATRLVIAGVFFRSGLTKLEDIDNAILLFEYEYAVPLLSPVFAAYAATAVELIAPVLLVLGLATRFAALPLLIMTAVIQFTYLDHMDHTYWALLLAILMTHGAGLLSADALIARKYRSLA